MLFCIWCDVKHISSFLLYSPLPPLALCAAIQKHLTFFSCGYWFQVAQPGELKVKGPLPNVDVEIHRKLYSQFPVDSNVRKWTQKERESLIKGVRQQVQEYRLRTAMEEFRYHSLGLSLSPL